MTFVKLHGEILDSSIWSEPHQTRIVWITMLAMADRDGVVSASVSGLAHRARVTPDECRAALKCFLSPDPDSRDRTTGERIEEVPGGWLLLNHANYRDRQTREQAGVAKRVAKHRAARRSTPLPSVTDVDVTPVTLGNATSRSEAEAEAEADQMQKQNSAREPRARAVARPSDVAESVWADWLVHRKRKRAAVTETAMAAIRREAEAAGMSLAEALTMSIAQGWQGFRAEWAAKRGRPTSAPPRVAAPGYYSEGTDGEVVSDL